MLSATHEIIPFILPTITTMLARPLPLVSISTPWQKAVCHYHRSNSNGGSNRSIGSINNYLDNQTSRLQLPLITTALLNGSAAVCVDNRPKPQLSSRNRAGGAAFLSIISAPDALIDNPDISPWHSPK